MSCSQVRAELLEHFAFREELGPRSWPHLEHLESCAECREEVGIDRALIRQLRGALQERMEGSAPSEASWGLVRRRTVDRPAQPWTARVVHRGGMVSAAAAACIMLFAVATAPDARLSPGTQPVVFDAALARRALEPLEEASDGASGQSSTQRAAEADLPPKGWATRTRPADDGASDAGELTFPGRML